MAYGTVKVDTIIFDQGGADQNATVSGIYRAITSGVTVSGTIAGAVLIGTTTVSGTTVTGTTANFASGVFTTQVSGATVTGTQSSFTSGNFVTLSGDTATFTSGVIASGTAAAPSLSIISDPNTGIYSPGADQVAVATNGTQKLIVLSNGNVGIGTSSVPSFPLHVVTSGNSGLAVYTGTSSANQIYLGNTAGESVVGTLSNQNFGIVANGGQKVTVTTGGNVGIGTTSPGGTVDIKAAASTAPLIVQGPSTEFARIDSSGRLLVGTSSARTTGTQTWISQIETGGSLAGLGITTNTANVTGAYLSLAKSRGSAVGSHTIVQNGDGLGYILFSGADGTDANTQAAFIGCEVDGTPGADDMPGRLVFSVTADGAASPTEALRIKSTRIVNIANTPVHADNAAAKTAGLVDGDVYRKSDGTMMIVFT